MIQESVAAPRFRTILSLVFAGIAGLLAIAGIYAVMAFEVNQQHSEFGIRMALGASPVSIMALVMRRALVMCSAGLLVGVAAALTLSKFVSSFVYGIEILDPRTYCLGAAAVTLVVLVAAAGPTWRTSRVDAAMVLRND